MMLKLINPFVNELKEKVDLKTIIGSASNPSILKMQASRGRYDYCRNFTR